MPSYMQRARTLNLDALAQFIRDHPALDQDTLVKQVFWELNVTQAKIREYLRDLVKAGLVVEDDDARFYHTADKVEAQE